MSLYVPSLYVRELHVCHIGIPLLERDIQTKLEGYPFAICTGTLCTRTLCTGTLCSNSGNTISLAHFAPRSEPLSPPLARYLTMAFSDAVLALMCLMLASSVQATTTKATPTDLASIGCDDHVTADCVATWVYCIDAICDAPVNGVSNCYCWIQASPGYQLMFLLDMCRYVLEMCIDATILSGLLE